MAAPQVTPPQTVKAPTPSQKPVRVDLHNPTRSRRTIDSGLEPAGEFLPGVVRPRIRLSIRPGETLRDVTIAEFVADELKARTRTRDTRDSDLHVYPAGKAPVAVAKAVTSDEDPDTDDAAAS